MWQHKCSINVNSTTGLFQLLIRLSFSQNTFRLCTTLGPRQAVCQAQHSQGCYVFYKIVNFHLCWKVFSPRHLPTRAQWHQGLNQKRSIHIFWYTFSFVFFNSKTGLFSCIFWSEDSFLCKFSWLCLHSGFTWWSWAKYIGWPKKYINMLNMWIQCYTSSRNITIGSKKWNRILKKIARSPIFCGCFWPFLAVFGRF